MTFRLKIILQLGSLISYSFLLVACRQSPTSSPAQNPTPPAVEAKAATAGSSPAQNPMAPAIGAKAATAGNSPAGLDGQTVVPGVYQIQSGIPYNGSQGLCWDLYSYTGGAAIIGNPCDGNSPTQLFRVNDDMDAGGYRTINSTYKEPNFDVVAFGNCPDGSCSGTTIMIAESTGAWNQHKSNLPAPGPPPRYRFNDIPNCPGCRYIAINPDGQWCVDRPSQNLGNVGGWGAYLQPFNCDGQQNQRWIMLGPK
jgi:hypothetical protein